MDSINLSLPKRQDPATELRTVVDNLLIEFISALFINMATVLCWTSTDISTQFVPAMVLGLVMICIKDEDYFFPDGSFTVTIVLWTVGGYASYTHVIARLFGHMLAFATAAWMLNTAKVPPLNALVEQSMQTIFCFEALATLIEHTAVVYVVMPLLPTINLHGTNFMFPKVKAKSHPDSQAPSNQAVMHVAITFAVLHWCLWRTFGTEMNPVITLLLTLGRAKQHPDEDPWPHCMLALWGQVVGLFICLVYTSLYVPREAKVWPQMKRQP